MYRLLMTDNAALYVIHILFYSFILLQRRNIITVLDLLPHIKKFDYLNCEIARQQCPIRITVELKKEKKRILLLYNGTCY